MCNSINFSCEKCGKRFTKSHHLKAHLNTHEKKAKFIPDQDSITPEVLYQDVMTILTATKAEAIEDEENLTIIQSSVDLEEEEGEQAVHLINFQDE